MKVKIDKAWELHNVMRTPKGLRTRRSLSFANISAVGSLVGGFTVESPSTSEPWHYIFEQVAATLAVRLSVFTENLRVLYTLDLGPMQAMPVITKAVVNNQVGVSSPSFSSTLYGQVGGGMVTAVATPSEDPTIVTLPVPTGHICSFADRWAVASGPVLSVNDARSDVDPRTFTALGLLSLPGTIFDNFQGADGQLYLFTSEGVFTVPPDALGVGQGISGFLSKVPGIFTKRPRNACATTRGVAVLQRTSVLLLNGGSQTEIPIGSHDGRRKLSRVVDVDDLRTIGSIFATAKGFIIGFGTDRGFYVDVDLEAGSVSFVYPSTPNIPFNLVGVCQSRDGDPILCFGGGGLANLAYDGVTGGPGDNGGADGIVKGIVAGVLDLEASDEPRVRRLSVAADNIGQAVGVAVNGVADTDTTPSLTTDAVIGTALWDAAAPFAGRTTRTTRMTVNVKTTEPHIEVEVDGSGRRVGDVLDLELAGLTRQKKDKQA